MAKKISFDNLPAAVEKILEILTSEGSEHTALPELIQRIVLLEKKIDHLEKAISPNRPVMDKHAVIKALKIRPKMLSDLEMSGVLPSHTEGRKTVFYEDDVVKFYMNQGWKAVAAEASKPVSEESVPAEPAPVDVPAEGRHCVDIHGASVVLDRKSGAVRQLLSKIPHYRDGRRIYFYTDELREWLKNHPPLKRKPKNP